MQRSYAEVTNSAQWLFWVMDRLCRSDFIWNSDKTPSKNKYIHLSQRLANRTQRYWKK